MKLKNWSMLVAMRTFSGEVKFVDIEKNTSSEGALLNHF